MGRKPRKSLSECLKTRKLHQQRAWPLRICNLGFGLLDANHRLTRVANNGNTSGGFAGFSTVVQNSVTDWYDELMQGL